MKQFILNAKPDAHRDNIVRLTGDDFHYLVKVRRLAVGEFFPAVMPDGEETNVQILSIENGALAGRCSASLDAVSQGTVFLSKKIPPIILFQALTKGDKMDMIVRQAAEGGITEIVPFVSEFSVAKINKDGQKFSRWERIVKEARQQSGSKTATTIHSFLKIDQLIEYWKTLKERNGGVSHGGASDGAAGFLFHHQGLEQNSLHSYLNIVPQIVVMAIGPEGGFSGAEAALFLENGFKPMKIGDTILRTETAALYCAAALKILLLERDSWELKQVKKSTV